MPAVTIRNLTDEVHRAVKAQARRNGRSAEAEIRTIIENAVRPSGRIRLGSILAQIGREFGGVELAIQRDQTPTDPVDLA